MDGFRIVMRNHVRRMARRLSGEVARTWQNLWVRVLGEGAFAGVIVGVLIGGWDVLQHRDLSYQTYWLAIDRLANPLILAILGGVAGSTLLASLWRVVRQWDGVRTSALLAVSVSSCAAAGWVAMMLRRDLTRLARWEEVRFELVVVGVAAIAGVLLAVSRIRDTKRMQAAAPSTGTAATLGFVAGAIAVFLWATPALVNRCVKGPSVVLVSIDTLRADRLGVMGYHRPTTPFLDRWARKGVVFERAISAAPWTLPAHVSLFTSKLPFDHDVRLVGSRVPPDQLMLAELFHNAGYRTAAFTGGGYVSWGYGFDQGFEQFEDHNEKAEGGPAKLASAALAWVLNGDAPFFLFVHTYEPHGPYIHTDFARAEDAGRLTPTGLADYSNVVPDPTESERRYIRDLYDGDIAHADRVIGSLLDKLDRAGYLQDAILTVTSDHGEDLWDHDATNIPRHGHSLYEEIVHIPLFITAPERALAGSRIKTPVSLIDVAPTLLELTGLGTSSVFDGISLADAVQAGNEPPGRTLISESTRYGPDRLAVRTGDRKIVLTPFPNSHEDDVRTPPRLEIFDLSTDPREQQNLSRDPPDWVKAPFVVLRDRAAAFASKHPDANDSDGTPPELLDQLRSLGYVE